ncbi:MAG: exo-alpha-sialidase [Gemmatimonadaceae bacterium]|nr:exo-alpha-sialidase [Gemmatimonadaceae bacterium]
MKFLAFSILVVLGCAANDAPRFRAAEQLAPGGELGTAPMFAVSREAAEAAAWISAPDGGSDGRLEVRVGDGRVVQLRDSLGPIEPHGESPPKLAWSPDGSLDALYVVAKLVPGRRFPASALRFVRSTDRGATWSTPVTVTDDSAFASHNFHALYAAPDGAVYASWLDGRTGKSTVFMTRSTDGGKTWMPNVRVTMSEACPCCRTTMASGPDGTLYLAWRRVFPGNVREVVVARSSDRGATWSEPVRAQRDGWVFDGCPHAGPSLQVDATGRVHIAWWSGKRGAAGVWYARSDDGAKSFSEPMPLGVAEFSRPAHVQLALGGRGRVVAAWDDGTLQTPRIVVRVSKRAGDRWSDPVTLSDSGRAAGFPVVAATRERIAVAWSEESVASAATHDTHTKMSGPHAMPLGTVGEARVLVRRGTLE